MIERRIEKPPEQIRAEAIKLAQADVEAFMLAGMIGPARSDQEPVLLDLYKWRYARIEDEATTFWSYGLLVSREQAKQWPIVTMAPLTATAGQPHTCTPSEPTSAGRYCTVCAKMIVEEPLTEIVI